MLEVRNMTRKDLEAVSILEKETFSIPWTKDGFEEALARADTLYLVAVMNSRLVGYCGFLHVLNEAYITNVAVEKNYRNLGVAERMLENLIKLGKQQGISAFTLEVRKSNKPAIRLYEKSGFVSAGIRKNFYEKPTEDAVIMWKHG